MPRNPFARARPNNSADDSSTPLLPTPNPPHQRRTASISRALSRLNPFRTPPTAPTVPAAPSPAILQRLGHVKHNLGYINVSVQNREFLIAASNANPNGYNMGKPENVAWKTTAETQNAEYYTLKSEVEAAEAEGTRTITEQMVTDWEGRIRRMLCYTERRMDDLTRFEKWTAEFPMPEEPSNGMFIPEWRFQTAWRKKEYEADVAPDEGKRFEAKGLGMYADAFDRDLSGR